MNNVNIIKLSGLALTLTLGCLMTTPAVADDVNFGPQKQVATFSYFPDGSTRDMVRYVYPVDLDGDRVQEVIFAGFETQPNTPAEYSNAKVKIFGWKRGSFKDLTSQWLPGKNSRFQGVGDIGFGDFNGDGRIDAFLSAYTDMAHPVNAWLLINKGNRFKRVRLSKDIWQHGVAVGDINNDGKDDVMEAGYDAPVSVYLGNKRNGLKQVELSGHHAAKDIFYNNYNGTGSGAAIADFLDEGRPSVIVADSSNADHPADTRLFRFVLNRKKPVALEPVSTLPKPRLEKRRWKKRGITGSHDVRVKAFDFNKDKLMDVIVFSRSWQNKSGEWPFVSAVQFLENRGNGKFRDVTGERLIDYDHSSNASYNPIFADFNKDGRTDIFLGEVSYRSKHNSHAFLLQNGKGQFVDTGRTAFNRHVGSAQAAIGSVVRGPRKNYFFVMDTMLPVTGKHQVSVARISISRN